MQKIFVSSQRFTEVGGTVSTISAGLAAEITTMRNVLTDIRSGWQSDKAAPAFAAGMLSYLDEAAALKDALAGHGEALKTSGTRFADAEADLATAMPAATK